MLVCEIWREAKGAVVVGLVGNGLPSTKPCLSSSLATLHSLLMIEPQNEGTYALHYHCESDSSCMISWRLEGLARMVSCMTSAGRFHKRRHSLVDRMTWEVSSECSMFCLDVTVSEKSKLYKNTVNLNHSTPCTLPQLLTFICGQLLQTFLFWDRWHSRIRACLSDF